MESIHLPTSITFESTDQENTGRVVVTPCRKGYGTTIGNALRRVLLSSLAGGAVESIKIDGVQHEFSGIEDVQEDMVEIILNVKQVAARVHSAEPVTLTLSHKGKGQITAGDFEKNSDVEIVNPDQLIMTVNSDSKQISMEMTVAKGRGYVPVAEKDTKDLPLGTISVDSLYTPVRDIGYDVELTRVGDVTDYERLVLTIVTNGTITPKDAVSSATKILMDHFALVLDAAGGSDDRSSDMVEQKPELQEVADEEPKSQEA